jgi:hypothetical protein
VVVPIYNPSYSGGSHSKPGWSKKQDLIWQITNAKRPGGMLL